MYQKQCRLTLADKFFGSSLGLSSPGIPGGSTKVDMRSWGEEKPDLLSGYKFQTNQLNQFAQGQPLLKTAETGGLDFWKQLDSLINPLTSTLTSHIAPILASGGALTPEGERDVAQKTRATFAAQGNAMGNQALGAELLNREGAQQTRYNTALGQAQGVASSVQGLQTGGLNQLLGVENAKVSNFGATTNPILSYLGNLFGGNQQASVAQAQINQQGNIADAQLQQKAFSDWINSMASVAGGIMSDERLKTKVRNTGLQTKEGVPWKFWEYITRPGVKFLGHMAQDVEKIDPAAVKTDPLSGVKSVGFKYFPIQLTKEPA